MTCIENNLVVQKEYTEKPNKRQPKNKGTTQKGCTWSNKTAACQNEKVTKKQPQTTATASNKIEGEDPATLQLGKGNFPPLEYNYVYWQAAESW